VISRKFLDMEEQNKEPMLSHMFEFGVEETKEKARLRELSKIRAMVDEFNEPTSRSHFHYCNDCGIDYECDDGECCYPDNFSCYTCRHDLERQLSL
jgi:hypothetical protein